MFSSPAQCFRKYTPREKTPRQIPMARAIVCVANQFIRFPPVTNIIWVFVSFILKKRKEGLQSPSDLVVRLVLCCRLSVAAESPDDSRDQLYDQADASNGQADVYHRCQHRIPPFSIKGDVNFASDSKSRKIFGIDHSKRPGSRVC